MDSTNQDYESLSKYPVYSDEWNKWLIWKYPFMKYGNCIDFTWANDFYEGWWSVFGLQMCEEINQVLLKESINNPNRYKEFEIFDVKEKYGSLRFDAQGSSNEIEGIIARYEKYSEKICCKCGKPATHITTGWILHFCSDCAPKDSITNEEYIRRINDKWSIRK